MEKKEPHASILLNGALVNCKIVEAGKHTSRLQPLGKRSPFKGCATIVVQSSKIRRDKKKEI